MIGNGARSLDSGSYTIVMGGNAQARASASIVMGDRAASEKNATGAVTIGQNARSANAGDVVLGRNSKTEDRTLDAKYYDGNSGIQNKLSDDLKIGETNIGNKGTKGSNQGVVSVGSSSLKRQIQNVGAGLISETSTDAINGSQLYHVIKAADEIAKTEYKFQVNGSNIKTMSNKGTSAVNNANNVLNFKAGDGLDVAYENNAVTYKLNADSKQAITDAKTAATTVTNKLNEINQSVARAETAAGKAETAKAGAESARDQANTAKNDAVTAKTAAEKAKEGAESARDQANTAKNDAVTAKTAAEKAKEGAESARDQANTAKNDAVTAKTAAETAADKAKDSENTVKMIKDRIEGSGLINADGETSFASNNASNRKGAKASGKDSSAMGYGSEAKGDHSTALGNNAKAHADRSTAIGHNAEAKAAGSVALGEGSVAKEENTISVGDVGHERRITNVQDPKNLTDAANKRYVDHSVNSVRNELKQTDRKLRGGIAGAVAMANIPTANRAGGTMVGIGVGSFKGQSAVAVGVNRASDSNRVHFKMSGSATTSGDYAVGAGMGYQW